MNSQHILSLNFDKMRLIFEDEGMVIVPQDHYILNILLNPFQHISPAVKIFSFISFLESFLPQQQTDREINGSRR